MPEQTPEQQREPTAVLCVDDDDLANATISNIIGSDAEFWVARDFSQAIASINRRPFALVFCDITSPKVRGMDVLSILADLHPSTPVIVTSRAGVADWTSDAFEELGAFAGMPKPYNVELLRLSINEVLWPQPVMGKGSVGNAVLLTAAMHETAGEEMARLSEIERNEVRTVVDVMAALMPFFTAHETPPKT